MGPDMKRIFATLVASMVTWGTPAMAAPTPISPAADSVPRLMQDVDDDLDDILGEGSGEQTIAEERRDMESGDQRDTEVIEVPDAKRKVIKTLQKKTFLKIGRGEVVPYLGIITNDPFIRRILFGMNVGYHITEIFQLELQGSFSPDFNEGDWKAVTRQILSDNQVSPEISRMMGHATVNFNFSPLYGKVATLGRNSIIFDIYLTAGAGVAFTEDDIELIQKVGDPLAEATKSQVHPTISFGGGLRVAFTKTFGLRFEVRSISYINALESTQLELKNNLTMMLGASIFLGRGRQ
jgi:outer membrane beta-barrel protein